MSIEAAHRAGSTALFLLALASSDAAAAAHRLASDPRPVAQHVWLKLDPRQPDYDGRVRITLEAARPFESMTLNGEGLTVTSASLVAAAGAPATLAWAAEPPGRIRFTLPAAAPAGRHELVIEFTNAFDTRATSLYRLKAGEDWYAFTQFEADDAREAFPCFDEPAFKIPWTLELVVPAGDLAVSNTPIEAETPAADGHTTVRFKTSKPMPSYIVAIATGPLETVPIEGMAIPGRVVTVKGQSHLAAEAQRACPPLLSALEAYFGRPYPYEKLDLLALPEFWPGAMENAGAITFADRVLLVDDRTVSLGQKRSLASILAHELAHMWFGDLVTMTWWDDLWLNESFASWLGEKVTHEVFPTYGVDLRLVADAEEAMQTDGRLSTRAIRQPVTSLDNLLQSADVLAYNKGQAVLGMFEQWMGPETFRAGVRDYIASHTWGNAVAADLWDALTKVAGKDVGGPMGTYLEQPGLALVGVEPLPGGRVRLSQSRFLPAGTSAPVPARWSIPLTLKYATRAGGTKTKNVLLDQPTQVVTLEPGVEWVYPNARAFGYYRWKMPDDAVNALVARATASLEPRERMEVVFNAGALLDAGAMPGDTYLAVLEKLAADPEPLVVDAVIDGLEKARVAFVEPSAEEAFARYVRRALAPALARFGAARQEGEAETVSLVRGALLVWLARDGRDARIAAYGDSLARAYLADATVVDPGVAGSALQIAALGGDDALWETFRTRFETTTNPGERRRYLEALGCFHRPELRARSLAYVLTGPLKPQETLTMPRMVGDVDEAGRAEAFQWLTTNYDAVLARVPPMLAVFMPYVGSGCSAERLARAQAFFAEPAHAPAGTEKEMAKLTERVEDCLELRRREGQRVRAYLNRAGVAN